MTILVNLIKYLEIKGVKIFCDLKSWLYVKGTTIDFSDDLLSMVLKLKIQMQNVHDGCGTSFKK